MCKLDFEWHDSRNGGEYRAEAGGFIVKAIRDESAESPWEAWDGQPPLIVYYDRSLDEKGDVPNPLSDMSDSFIVRNWRALCKIFDQSPDAAKERKSDYEYERIADAKLWGAWAWGDVYGFVIESADGTELPGDCLDSCWGFYGDDFNWSGLAEAAAESLAYIRKERRERRFAKMKELIRARVPLAIRAAILEGFPL